VPLLWFVLFVFWNALIPHDQSIQNCSCHIQEIELSVVHEFSSIASIVPAVKVEVFESFINFAFIRPHVVELVSNSTDLDPVIERIVLNHAHNPVGFVEVSWTKTVFVQNDRIIHVHTSFDTCQKMMRHVEIPFYFRSIYYVWHVIPRMLIRLLFLIESFPEFFIVVLRLGKLNQDTE